MVDFSSIPLDIVRSILNNLISDITDIAALELVCRTWYNISKERLILTSQTKVFSRMNLLSKYDRAISIQPGLLIQDQDITKVIERIVQMKYVNLQSTNHRQLIEVAIKHPSLTLRIPPVVINGTWLTMEHESHLTIKEYLMMFSQLTEGKGGISLYANYETLYQMDWSGIKLSKVMITQYSNTHSYQTALRGLEGVSEIRVRNVLKAYNDKSSSQR